MEKTTDQKPKQPINEHKPAAFPGDAQKPKKPVSERKLAANRANAKKGTGPRTPPGKARSSQNAIKYGFYARGVVLNSENAEDFDNLREHVWNQLQPRNALEEIVVREIVDTHWRLQRLGFAEQTVFTRRSVSFNGQECGPGFAFVNDVQGFNTFSSLARVDAMLTRRLYRAIAELRKLREGKSSITLPQTATGSETADECSMPDEPAPATNGAEPAPQPPGSFSGQPVPTGLQAVPLGPELKLPLPQPAPSEAASPAEECPSPPAETRAVTPPAMGANPQPTTDEKQ